MNIFFHDRTVYDEKSAWKLLKRVGFALIILLALTGWTSSDQILNESHKTVPEAEENFNIEILEPGSGAGYSKCMPITAQLKADTQDGMRAYGLEAESSTLGFDSSGARGKALIKWDIKADGVTVGTKETDAFQDQVSLNFNIKKAGKIEITASAFVMVEYFDGSKSEIIAIGTSAEVVTIKVEECTLGVVGYYRGQFADEFWTWTEAGTLLLTEVTAPPNGSHSGTGEMTLTSSGYGVVDGGYCILSPPALGISKVNITGELDADTGKIGLDFGFEPSADPGRASNTCTARDITVVVGVQPYRPMDPSIFGLNNLDFMLPTTTRNIIVSEGFATQVAIPRPGTGVITLTTVLLDEPGSAIASQPDTQVAADFWQLMISIFDKVAG